MARARKSQVAAEAPRPRKLVTCYNPACADYRRERPYPEPCACTRRSVREPMLSITPEQ
jgi:hypothetical protein